MVMESKKTNIWVFIRQPSLFVKAGKVDSEVLRFPMGYIGKETMDFLGVLLRNEVP